MILKESRVERLTAAQLLTYLSWVIFVIIFVVVTVQAIRHPSRSHIDIALLFGAIVVVIAVTVATLIGLISPTGVAAYIASSALLALPYLLVRLVDDIIVTSRWLRLSVEVLLIAALVCLWLLPLERPQWISSILLLYVVGVLVYVVGASIHATLHTRGVTRRRLTAMSMGSLFLVLDIAIASLGLWFPQQLALWRGIAEVLGLAAGISYLVGFAPPRWLRRAWQEPELRAFLGRAATLPRLPNI
jgi:hypothetical protein